ncbi:MAG: hypothetical protein C4519_28590 [Desulfobacteraceae bacterium]|nr:MAG: hypothetical protein C4519_28590 [Desulfobacteraceae bacterium]
MLSMKSLAKAIGAKKAAMAMPSDVERVTGYILGGVSPLVPAWILMDCRRGCVHRKPGTFL